MASVECYPALVALLCTAKGVYLSGPASIWVLYPNGGLPERLAGVPLPWPYRQAARWRLGRRLGRLDIRELLEVPGGGLLGISQKWIISLNPDSGELHPVFQVADGGRPKGLALTPAGYLFVGEYWSNPRRQALRIWASLDKGASWELAYTLPAGSAKHIHNIVWDQYRHGLWVLTGDSDGECALLFSPDELQTVTKVAHGGQLYRACHLFCRPEGLYYGTDTERDQNWIIRFDVQSGALHKIHPLSGSCIHAAYMAGQYLITSAVEPSKINSSRKTVLWSSPDLYNWSILAEFQKDWWPGEYFGFGRIILPRVQGEYSRVVFSTIAVKGHDLTTYIMK